VAKWRARADEDDGPSPAVLVPLFILMALDA
jgi:hypothetical protein